MRRLLVLATALLAACVTPDVVPLNVARDLAPSGTLHAAINYGNPVLAQRDAASGELRGVSVDLARELARRAGVPVELRPYDAAGKVTADATSNKWDVAFFAIDPKRAVYVDDVAVNVDAAWPFGIHAIHFTTPYHLTCRAHRTRAPSLADYAFAMSHRGIAGSS